MEMMNMNSYRATLVFSALLSVGAAVASAQTGTTPQSGADQSAPPAASSQRAMPSPDKQAKRLAKELNLTPDQVTQIKPILADRTQQMQALQADTSMAQADRRAKAKSIMADSNSKIEGVLNDQQKQQFEQMQAARKAKHQQKMQQPSGM
jgi:periplasmic protein CpxP/Spy